MRRWVSSIPRRELLLLGAIMAAGLLLRLAYVLATKDHTLAGDEVTYDTQGRFIEAGKILWGTDPFGVPHETIWKMPLYPLWVGLWYSVLGADPDRVLALQTLLGPVTIGLTWALGRRLVSPKAGLVAAAIVAIYPFAWQFEARLYSESLAVPLTLAFLLVVLDRVPTPRLAVLAGVLLALNVYARPSAVILIGVLAIAWWFTAGMKRGTVMAAASVGILIVALAPWWYRSYDLEGGFVPLSTQDAALIGTFNQVSANDDNFPYKWRPNVPAVMAASRGPDRATTETEWRARLRDEAFDYIADHPESVPKAFFYNGITRTFDLRRPSAALVDVSFEGRSRDLTKIGLGMYWPMLALALVALWRWRPRPQILVPLLAMALATAIVYTADGGTRYRAPLEPVIAILAASTLVAAARYAAMKRAGPDADSSATLPAASTSP